MTFIINGAPRTKKNHGRRVQVRIKGTDKTRPLHLPSPQYLAWEEKALWQFKAQWAQMRQQVALDCNVNVRAIFYRDALRGDAVGYYQALADALQKAGIVEDDVQIVSWDGSRLMKDPKNPRIELEITPCD